MKIRNCPSHMKQPVGCEIVDAASNHEEYSKYAEDPGKYLRCFHVTSLLDFGIAKKISPQRRKSILNSLPPLWLSYSFIFYLTLNIRVTLLLTLLLYHSIAELHPHFQSPASRQQENGMHPHYQGQLLPIFLHR